MGQEHEHTDWALRGFCAQAWFRCASTGERTDVQAQERGDQRLPRGPRDCEPARVAGNHGKVPLPTTLPNASNDPPRGEVRRMCDRRSIDSLVVSFENQVASGA